MNTNALSKQYDKLTPPERFALILSAVARDDETERLRLVQSAPRESYSAPDYFWLASRYESLATLHFIKLLDFAAEYFQWFDRTGQRGKKREDEWAARECVGLAGYAFKTFLAGWRIFCAKRNLDPEVWWKRLPGYERIKRAERLSEDRPDGLPGLAFVEEGVARVLIRSKLGDPEARIDDELLKAVHVLNADDIAEGLAELFEEVPDS